MCLVLDHLLWPASIVWLVEIDRRHRRQNWSLAGGRDTTVARGSAKGIFAIAMTVSNESTAWAFQNVLKVPSNSAENGQQGELDMPQCWEVPPKSLSDSLSRAFA